ncbi:MAG: hypothetical protein ACLGIN_05350 [Candidatus Sericytochromatia bacterium]
MADTRINSTSGIQPKVPPKQAPKVENTSATQKVATDQLRTQGVDQAEAALKILEKCLPLQAKPKKAADVRAWAMDSYARMLKAERALDALKSSPGADREKTSQAWFALRDAHRQMDQADKGGKIKQEFFAGVLPEANQLIDSLKDFREPPADKAGKEAWLAEGKTLLAQAKAADDLIRSAWFDFRAIDFDQRTDVSGKPFEFQSRLRRVEYELNPPAPRDPSAGPSRPGSRPIFGATQGAADLANSKNPVGQAVGAVALPIALTIDTIDLITRPFQWLSSLSGDK